MSEKKSTDLKTRIKVTLSIGKTQKDTLDRLSEQTKVPKSKLMDEAINDLVQKRSGK